MKIEIQTKESRRVDQLKPFSRNPREHSPAHVAQIVALIREFKWTMPILIDPKNGIIAGHGRVLAAKELGIDVLPVIIARGWSEAQKRAYIIADNQATIAGNWNDDLLRGELSFLQGAGFDLKLTAFSDLELGRFDLPGFDQAAGDQADDEPRVKLSDRFGVPPFSVLNAREGWWQARKGAWIALGIRSELGRGETAGGKLTMSQTVHRLKPAADQARKKANATPGGSKMPAANYSKNRARGDGRGRAVRT